MPIASKLPEPIWLVYTPVGTSGTLVNFCPALVFRLQGISPPPTSPLTPKASFVMVAHNERDYNFDLPSLRATVQLAVYYNLVRYHFLVLTENSREDHLSMVISILVNTLLHVLTILAIFDVKFYPYTLPGVDSVFAVCGDNFVWITSCPPDMLTDWSKVIVCRCLLDKHNAFENLLELRYEKNDAKDRDVCLLIPCDRNAADHICPPLQGVANSLAWSQADNGDPLLCVAGTPQIRVYNISTQQLEVILAAQNLLPS